MPTSPDTTADSSTPVLALDGVAKRYGDLQALAPTTLHVARGEVVVLIGPSGCGKSTLLRIVAGLVAPDAGTVTLGGTRLAPSTAMELRHRMGYVIQEGGLFPHLTAAENAELLARHGGVPGWSDARRAERLGELAALVQLPPESLRRYPTQLSGGQRQRVSLMRALFLAPDLLLLDEPLGALDPLIRADLQRDLRALLRERQQTALFVTHDLREAAYFADRIVLLRSGQIEQTGTFADLAERPATPFVRRFVEAQA